MFHKNCSQSTAPHTAQISFTHCTNCISTKKLKSINSFTHCTNCRKKTTFN
ncbi:hypothetical protein Pint_22434 [Pistacia integerrima]|uniref:Uncharacterized protein n=1 Tax=Pistacia integerrima TaxID=434235 RepID=A0ACC0YLK9_9ROSI|nr:hypothetical protein Pint_22434 [Pistacia integerrima]